MKWIYIHLLLTFKKIRTECSATQLTIIFFIFVIAAGLRFHKLDKYLFFGFEQGRDALIAREISSFSDIKLIGPKTDLDGVFHGVWWYYLLALLYPLSAGSPIVVTFILAILQLSILPVTGLITHKLTSNKWISIYTMLLMAISFEHISFTRWLSNVTPAYVFLPLSVLFLLHYIDSKKTQFLILCASSAALAAQFQIALSIPVLGIGVLTWHWYIRKLELKQQIIIFIAGIFWYLPLLAFNLRYQFQSVHSALKFISESSATETITYQSMTQSVVHSFSRLSDLSLGENSMYGFLALLALVLLVYRKKLSSIFHHKLSIVLLVFLSQLMFVPFKSFIEMSHVRPGFGSLYIVIFSYLCYTLLKSKARVLVPIFMIFPLLALPKVWHDLETNSNLFFRTIQDEMRIDHQIEVLDWIESKSIDVPYEFRALTIPYLQEEGWNYLLSWKGYSPSPASSKLFVVIEKHVDPFWETFWINEYPIDEELESLELGGFRVRQFTKLSSEE